MPDADVLTALPIVLALDQSPKHTGWAVGTPLESKPAFGVFDMPPWGDDAADRLQSFRDWLTGTITGRRVTHLFYESPVNPPFKSFDVTRMQGKQVGVIELVAADLLERVPWKGERQPIVPVFEVAIDSWRSRFLGTTKAPAGLSGKFATDELKQMALRSCALRGWYVSDHNAAEALGILDYALSVVSPKHAGNRDPIFRRLELQADVAKFRGEG